MKENNDRAFIRVSYLLKRIYYSGSGKDLDTLKLILSDLKHIEDVMVLNAKVIFILTQNNRNIILDIASSLNLAQKFVSDFTRGEVWHAFPERSNANTIRF